MQTWHCTQHPVTRAGNTITRFVPGTQRAPGVCVLMLVRPTHAGTLTVRRLGMQATCPIVEGG